MLAQKHITFIFSRRDAGLGLLNLLVNSRNLDPEILLMHIEGLNHRKLVVLQVSVVVPELFLDLLKLSLVNVVFLLRSLHVILERLCKHFSGGLPRRHFT